jgi:hypothetical protein
MVIKDFLEIPKSELANPKFSDVLRRAENGLVWCTVTIGRQIWHEGGTIILQVTFWNSDVPADTPFTTYPRLADYVIHGDDKDGHEVIDCAAYVLGDKMMLATDEKGFEPDYAAKMESAIYSHVDRARMTAMLDDPDDTETAKDWGL